VAPTLLVVASSSDSEKSYTLSDHVRSAVNLTPLLYVIGTLKMSLLLLLRGLFAAISTVSPVLAIASVNGIDLMILLLP
jgi:hypothetical protein